MRRIIVGIAVFTAITMLIGCGKLDNTPDYVKKGNLYTRIALVGNLDYEKDVVSCIDTTGGIWEFDWVDDWEVGDVCVLVIDGKGTITSKDDEIILYTYSYATLH